MRKHFLLLILFILSVSSLSAKGKSFELVPGEPFETKVSVRTGNKSLRFEIPENYIAGTIELSGASVDLDLAIYKDDEELILSEKNINNEKIRFSRNMGERLSPGVYELKILYQYNDTPVINGESTRLIPCTVHFSIIDSEKSVALRLNSAHSTRLDPDEGMVKNFSFTVPRSTDSIRIDIYDTSGDIDFFVQKNSPVLDWDDSDFSMQTYRSRESLIISKNSSPQLESGTYYIQITEQVAMNQPIDFTIQVTKGSEAPAHLKELPQLESYAVNSISSAIRATPELVLAESGGSGCFISPEGHLITNYHVISDDAGGIAEDIFIALTLNPREPATDLFIAKVLEYDEEKDIALLQIESGLYGQPLPRNYRFPYYQLRDTQTLLHGEQLQFLGYPEIGTINSRASITLTKGIVSGFDRQYFGMIIKTDGEINSGNSGGAAFDSNFKLIGMPTQTMSDDGGQIAYIHPIELIPRNWYHHFK